MNTCAPSATKCLAAPRPIPALPPVTTATLFVSFFSINSPLVVLIPRAALHCLLIRAVKILICAIRCRPPRAPGRQRNPWMQTLGSLEVSISCAGAARRLLERALYQTATLSEHPAPPDTLIHPKELDPSK